MNSSVNADQGCEPQRRKRARAAQDNGTFKPQHIRARVLPATSRQLCSIASPQPTKVFDCTGASPLNVRLSSYVGSLAWPDRGRADPILSDKVYERTSLRQNQ